MEKSTDKSLSPYAEWSKWLIGVGVAAVAGCITMLKAGATEQQHNNLLWAIGCFLVSIAVAAILSLFVAWKSNRPSSKRGRACARILAVLQLIALGVGGIWLFDWVYHVSPIGKPAVVAAAAEPENEVLEPGEDIRATVRTILGEELQRIGEELQQPVPAIRPRVVAPGISRP
jgi:cytochrome bd-type quinol oxidase subunit 2